MQALKEAFFAVKIRTWNSNVESVCGITLLLVDRFVVESKTNELRVQINQLQVQIYQLRVQMHDL